MLPRLSPLQVRLLALSFCLAAGLPLGERRIRASVTPDGPPLFVYHGTRGPLAGRRTAGEWVSDRPAAQFTAGTAVLWESWTDVQPGTTVSAEFTLWCGGRPVQAEDAHVSAREVRQGWKMFGLSIPDDAKGECEVRRHAQFIAPDGERIEEHEFAPPIRLTVAPP